MFLLWGTNWVFVSQKTALFIVTAVITSNLTFSLLQLAPSLIILSALTVVPHSNLEPHCFLYLLGNDLKADTKAEDMF
jgi:hypothetical protein